MFYRSKKKIIFSVILVLILAGLFGSGFWMGRQSVVCKFCKPETLDFSLFWEAYGKLQQNFIHPENINVQKIIYGAISGMTKTLGDPYTSFLDPEEAQKFEQDLSGSFEGIGVEIGIKKDQLTIIAPLEGTPGQKAGLKSGDVILKIEGKDASNMTTDEAVSLIRGKKGTSVTLTIFRDDWSATKDIAIIRDTIVIPTIKWELKDGNVAYVHIFQFGQSLKDDFRRAASEIISSPAQKIVLDLRDNPGGYLDICQDIAGWFLEKGQVVTIEDFGGKREQNNYLAQGNSALLSYPAVVLINEGSASASEILAGALRDDRGIRLIGEKSFGKGSVQEVVYLSDSSFLKITVAKWLTPKGNSITEVGLEPDIKVVQTDQNSEQNKDPQLNKALEIIKTIK